MVLTSGCEVGQQMFVAEIYGSYFFFALSSHLPIALIVFDLALVGFFGTILWVAWQAGPLQYLSCAGFRVCQ